jgi:gluconokinase
MGVSGSGKTTIAALLAGLLRCEFTDADSLHPSANIQKMASGIALTDDDRWPWLHAVRAWIENTLSDGKCGVVACSALKRAYRDMLVSDSNNVHLVYLRADRDTVRHRMTARQGHFMPVALVDTQFAALEEPAPDENPIVVSVDAEPQAIAAEILKQLGLKPASSQQS